MTQATTRAPTVFKTRVFMGTATLEWLSREEPHAVGPNTFSLINAKTSRQVIVAGGARVLAIEEVAAPADLPAPKPPDAYTVFRTRVWESGKPILDWLSRGVPHSPAANLFQLVNAKTGRAVIVSGGDRVITVEEIAAPAELVQRFQQEDAARPVILPIRQS